MTNIVSTKWLVICCWAALSSFAYCANQNSRRAINNISSVSSNNQSSSTQQRQQDAVLPIGEAFNLFQSYGLLAFNINVAPLVLLPTRPQNGSMQPYQMPLFQMTTHPVLDRRMYAPEIKRQVNNPRGQQQVMERSVRLHLCPNIEALMTRFLHGFTVDGLHKPWWAFTASWKKHVLPRIYGIPANYLSDDYVYLLVRIEKRSVVGSINGSMLLEPDLLAKLPAISETTAGQAAGVGSKYWRTAVDFFLQFGSHIISDYSAGDALFQVMVYNASSLPSLNEKMMDLRSQVDRFNPANATKVDWSTLLLGHSPPVHVGKLQLISGNRTLINWLEPRLALSNLPETLPSSIRLLAAPVLFNLFYRQMQPRAVLSMNLVAITKAIPETPRRQWLNDVLLNLLRMWEYNM